MALLLTLLGLIFFGSFAMEIACDQEDEKQERVCCSLLMIGGVVFLVTLFAVAIL